MNKAELLGALQNILNNFVFGMVASRLCQPGTLPSGSTATFQGPQGELLTVNLEPLRTNFASPQDRKILIEEFENRLKRSILRETHEVLLAYARQTNQFPVYKNQPWFQFARIIRNVVSHEMGGALLQLPSDLTRHGILSVSWRGRVIDTSMLGNQVSFTHQEALQLFQDQLDFAKGKLA